MKFIKMAIGSQVFYVFQQVFNIALMERRQMS